jgi:hypothetical protein
MRVLRSLILRAPGPILALPAVLDGSQVRASDTLTRPQLEVCHGYGCKFRSKLVLTAVDQRRFATLLGTGSKSPSSERSAISGSVRYLENLTRKATGFVDEPKSGPGTKCGTGQMDCIDESTNTHSLLVYLQSRGLLKHHRVTRNVSRGFFFDGRYPHSTAVIVDSSGTPWVVDSWYGPMGGPPDILPLRDWLPRGFLASGVLTEREKEELRFKQ